MLYDDKDRKKKSNIFKVKMEFLLFCNVQNCSDNNIKILIVILAIGCLCIVACTWTLLASTLKISNRDLRSDSYSKCVGRVSQTWLLLLCCLKE